MQPVTTHVQNVPVVNNTSVATKSQSQTSANNPMVASQHTRQPVVRSTSGISSNKFATGSNQNCGNFITDRPTTRVHAPPGGKSSGPLW